MCEAGHVFIKEKEKEEKRNGALVSGFHEEDSMGCLSFKDSKGNKCVQLVWYHTAMKPQHSKPFLFLSLTTMAAIAAFLFAVFTHPREHSVILWVIVEHVKLGRKILKYPTC